MVIIFIQLLKFEISAYIWKERSVCRVELREVTYLAVVLRIFVSVLVGGIIGLDRGLKNRPAGLRTYMVVCLGACLIMLTNQYVCQV